MMHNFECIYVPYIANMSQSYVGTISIEMEYIESQFVAVK